MKPRHVALVGLMGCGKSTIGALVAKRLKMRFVDLDAAIVAKHGPIDAIFANEGEAAFRKYEYEVLCEALSDEETLLSTGGGILTYEPSRRFISEITSIYLEASVTSIVRRLSRSNVVRPLIGAGPTHERVQQLYDARCALYQASSFRVDAERDVNVVVSSVLRLLKKR